MRYIVERNFVSVVGMGWYGQQMAYQYPLDSSALRNIGEFNQSNVAEWLTTHSGDFQFIDGFYATAGDLEIPWTSEEAEIDYQALMYPQED